MLRQKQIRVCQNMTFMFSTLTIAILSAQYGHAANVPEVGSIIQNTAYATFIAANGKEQQSVSNTVGATIEKNYQVQPIFVAIVLSWTFIFILTSYYILKKRDL